MTPRQLRIIELRGKLMGYLSAAERDKLMEELGRLVKAEAVVRLPGASMGADMETAIAREDGIPVFDGVEAFLAR